MKYTFTLREGLRWHDGQPVVSEDCVESLKRWGQKDTGEQVAYLRNSEYVPRDDIPSGSTGGKKVYLDKVVW